MWGDSGSDLSCLFIDSRLCCATEVSTLASGLNGLEVCANLRPHSSQLGGPKVSPINYGFEVLACHSPQLPAEDQSKESFCNAPPTQPNSNLLVHQFSCFVHELSLLYSTPSKGLKIPPES